MFNCDRLPKSTCHFISLFIGISKTEKYRVKINDHKDSVELTCIDAEQQKQHSYRNSSTCNFIPIQLI